MEREFLQLCDTMKAMSGREVYSCTLPLAMFNTLLGEVSRAIGLKKYPTERGSFHLGGVLVNRGYQQISFELK